MFRNIFLLAVLCLVINISVNAQLDQNRTDETKVADLLSRFPAYNQQKLHTLMEDMNLMGETGWMSIAEMLEDNNPALKANATYALAGFTQWLTQKGKEKDKKRFEHSLIKMLDRASDSKSKQFYLFLMQWMGTETVIETVARFLLNDSLCGAATRTLVKIGGPVACDKLSANLKVAPEKLKSILVQGIREIRCEGATGLIEQLTELPNPSLRQQALLALGTLASSSSQPILYKQVTLNGFTGDPDHAMQAYQNYLINLLSKGEKEEVVKFSKQLFEDAKKYNQTAIQNFALDAWIKAEGEMAATELISMLPSMQQELRKGLHNTLRAYNNPSFGQKWLTAYRQSNAEAKADILSMVFKEKNPYLPEMVKDAIRSRKPGLRNAGINAAGYSKERIIVEDLVKKIPTADSSTLALLKQIFLTIPDTSLSSQLTSLRIRSAAGKIMVLEFLGEKRARDKYSYVKNTLTNSSSEVKKAAYKALKWVADDSHLQDMLNLIIQTDDPNLLKEAQLAAEALLKEGENKSTNHNLVFTLTQNESPSILVKVLPLLAAIGNETALEKTLLVYGSNDPVQKAKALDALANWNGTRAYRHLRAIADSCYKPAELNIALKGMLRSVQTNPSPKEMKVIKLREALALSNTREQKILLLRELGNHKTIQALTTAGDYLDQVELSAIAADIVVDIALSESSLKGPLVNSLLEKSLSLIKGNDSEYKKQSVRKYLLEHIASPGFVSLFNKRNLQGWKGLVGNPITRQKMDKDSLQWAQMKADRKMKKSWEVVNGDLVFTGHGDNICTENQYRNFELYVDWKIEKDGDAGIYLRGSPQVQIWDTARRDVGAQVGSGGLYNNRQNPKNPIVLADNAIGEWNSFRIIMIGDKVSVWLNGIKVVDSVVLENYWNRKLPIFELEQIELQAHGNRVAYRDIYIREIETPALQALTTEEEQQGFRHLFNGNDLDKWRNASGYSIEKQILYFNPAISESSNLFTAKEYNNFHLRFEFRLTPGANNGLAIRSPLQGDPAYHGIEIQILDDNAAIYRNLQPYQYHGSVYGIVAAKKGFLKDTGEWNEQEVIIEGDHIRIILNGETIVDSDLQKETRKGTADKREHPGIRRTSGHIGFLGHGSPVYFRNIRIKEL